MSSVISEATKFVVDQGIAGGALAGSGALLISLAKLVGDIHSSKEMCQDLISNIGALLPQLETMLKNDNIETAKGVLADYERLLREVKVVVQNHADSNLWRRVTNYRKMKKCVQQFYVDLKRIENMLDLKRQEEDANRHGTVTGILNQWRKIDQQATSELSANLSELTTRTETMTDLVTDLGNDKMVILADLKHELKSHQDKYSKTQIHLLQSILQNCKALAPNPHLSRWYLSRSDFCFDERSPFTTGKFRSIHHGNLVSGAEVTIKAVVADTDDKQHRNQFRKEVEIWYTLRNPHILPLYGANDIGSPMVFVCGRAEYGNFNEYLSTHPNRFWQVFLDAARGLAYLHNQKPPIVHGNLKCSNLLVTKQGVGVISDFLFSFVRNNTALSFKVPAPDHFWKAPECFNVNNPNPRFESDVYSLGMCIFEAMSCQKPFAGLKEEDATDRIKAGELPQRPAGKITEEAWDLITRMCCWNFQARIHLEKLIDELQALAAIEQVLCSQLPCSCTTACCLECGGQRRFTSSESVPPRSPGDSTP